MWRSRARALPSLMNGISGRGHFYQSEETDGVASEETPGYFNSISDLALQVLTVCFRWVLQSWRCAESEHCIKISRENSNMVLQGAIPIHHVVHWKVSSQICSVAELGDGYRDERLLGRK